MPGFVRRAWRLQSGKPRASPRWRRLEPAELLRGALSRYAPHVLEFLHAHAQLHEGEIREIGAGWEIAISRARYATSRRRNDVGGFEP